MIRAAFRNGDRGLGWAVLGVAILLPLGDALLGRVVLQHKCETEGAIVIAERVKDVDGFAKYSIFSDSPAHYGYQFVETEPRRSRGAIDVLVDRAEFVEPEKRTKIVKNVVPKARYSLHTGQRHSSLYFFQTEISIREIATDRKLSGFSWFQFRGGWVERILSAFSGAQPSSVAACGNYEVRSRMEIELLHGTLIQPHKRTGQEAPPTSEPRS